MPRHHSILALLILLLLLPSPTCAEGAPKGLATQELKPEQAPVDLPVVEAEMDPIRLALHTASSPSLSDAQKQRQFDQIVAQGQAALPTLAAVYADPASDDKESWIAARALGRIGGEGAMRTLIKGLESSRIIARLGAVSGLQLIGHKDSAAALERALFDKAMTVRSMAADALGAIGARSSYEALGRSLNIPANYKDGKSLFVRVHVVNALGTIGSIGGIDVLVQTLADKRSPDCQIAAAAALTQITGKSYHDPAYPPGTPPQDPEIARWTDWWSQRTIGRTAE